MKARDVFGVGVRIVGLVVLLWSLWYLAFGIAFVIRALEDTGHEADMGAYFTTGIPGFFVGMILLRFARQLVRFSYPSDREDSDP
jgi:hypothetical protein